MWINQCLRVCVVFEHLWIPRLGWLPLQSEFCQYHSFHTLAACREPNKDVLSPFLLDKIQLGVQSLEKLNVLKAPS